MIDIDLSILGSAQDRFAAYETQARAEYNWVEESVFWSLRGKIMREFLNREPLYHIPFFRDQYEAQAKLNLSRYR